MRERQKTKAKFLQALSFETCFPYGKISKQKPYDAYASSIDQGHSLTSNVSDFDIQDNKHAL